MLNIYLVGIMRVNKSLLTKVKIPSVCKL